MTQQLDPVLREEADHANEDYAPNADNLEINESMFVRYRSPQDVTDWRQMASMLLGDLRGMELLDYGCGMGEESVYFAKLGAKVTGIDISEVGIASLQKRAAHHGLPIKAMEMRVDPTTFPDKSFDRIHGLGILHHVGMARGMAEIHRLLRPGGVAVFLEPLGDNRAIETVKEFIMKNARFLGEFDEVTDHERNLTWEEIERETAKFRERAAFPYHLTFRLKRFIPQRAWGLVKRFDHAMLTMAPGLKRFAGGVAIRVVK